MTDRPRAFFAIDRGTATTAASIVGRVAGRWRLLGSAALPAAVDSDAILGLLVARLRAADPDLAADLGVPATPAPAPRRATTAGLDGLVDLAQAPEEVAQVDWPRLEAGTTTPATLAILAPSERRRAELERAAVGSGWALLSASLERGDALGLMTTALGHDVRAVVLGAGSPASADESRALRELAPLVAAVAERRPEVAIVLVGAAGQAQAAVETARGAPGSVLTLRDWAGTGAGAGAEALRVTLDGLRDQPGDSRRGIVRATATLARVLERRVETVEIGLSGGLRAEAGRRAGRTDEPGSRSAIVVAAGLARAEPDDELLDGVIAWSSVPIDRPRLRDRLRELWLAPWAEAHGEGALLRLTAARAALGRLVHATPEFDDLPSPDILVIAGGVWAVAPIPAVAVAVMDVVRRTGVSQLVFDHARLLGPIGTIVDDAERAALIAHLVDDALTPLGTAVVPQGLRAGRFVGRAVVHRQDAPSLEAELVAGRIVSLDVPPGETAAAELDFRDGVVLGGRGRRFAVDVAGGMGGILVDLRDVPLRLPDQIERRREALAAWQQPLWSPLESVTTNSVTRAAPPEAGFHLVGLRHVVVTGPMTWFPLHPGDRPLVSSGETVAAGTPLAELLHDRRLVDVPVSVVGEGARPGAPWDGHPRRGVIRRRGPDVVSGELLFEVGGRWRVATGEPGGLLEAPAAGIVRDVRPGIGITLQVAGCAIEGVRAIGAPARGRLDVATGADSEIRTAGLDVGRAGAILVMGGRVDAEILTRARAMGIRGIVVGSLTAKDIRDFAASEARQRASLHRLPPFAVLVLDGAIRRAVATPVRAVLAALAGRDVAISAEPPQLLFDPDGVRLPQAAAGLVRVRQGAWGGREGRWAGPAGVRHFRGGVRLEAGFVRFDDGPAIALPLADLERFA